MACSNENIGLWPDDVRRDRTFRPTILACGRRMYAMIKTQNNNIDTCKYRPVAAGRTYISHQGESRRAQESQGLPMRALQAPAGPSRPQQAPADSSRLQQAQGSGEPGRAWESLGEPGRAQESPRDPKTAAETRTRWCGCHESTVTNGECRQYTSHVTFSLVQCTCFVMCDRPHLAQVSARARHFICMVIHVVRLSVL